MIYIIIVCRFLGEIANDAAKINSQSFQKQMISTSITLPGPSMAIVLPYDKREIELPNELSSMVPYRSLPDCFRCTPFQANIRT